MKNKRLYRASLPVPSEQLKTGKLDSKKLVRFRGRFRNNYIPCLVYTGEAINVGTSPSS